MDYVNGLNAFTSSYTDVEDSANVILEDSISNGRQSDRDFENISSSVLVFFSPDPVNNFSNAPGLTNATISDTVGYRDPLSIILPISVCYLIIFITGILGNVITCFVIAKNKTMHTATNYYLFNLAVSDFLVLVFGMPFDFMNIWLPNSYPFDETVCILQGFLSETSTNATILTITSFTCERYIAICHPFRSHTMSKLSRVIRFIFAIWILAFALAAPQAFQFGTVEIYGGVSCTVKTQYIEHAFEVSSFVFFIVPMTVICVLYILIGLKLRQSKLLYGKKIKTCDTQRCIKGQSRVVRMLIAVVVCFFFCWAPFHAQRIMAVYGKIMSKSLSSDDLFMRVYVVLTYISGITYFLSTCINPFLYNIMSHKFRNASKLTLVVHCFNRTPSVKKSQINSNFSALTLKFGALEPGHHMTTFNRSNFMIPPENSREIIQIKDSRRTEVGNFACRSGDLPQFMMDRSRHPSESVVKFSSRQESNNLSYSQTTTTTTLSRENSFQYGKPKKVRVISTNPQGVSFAEKLRKCTQKVLSFKSDANATSEKTVNNPKISKKVSNESLRSGNTISNSSLKEIDEEEFTSSELAQKMYEINNEIRHISTQTP